MLLLCPEVAPWPGELDAPPSETQKPHTPSLMYSTLNLPVLTKECGLVQNKNLPVLTKEHGLVQMAHLPVLTKEGGLVQTAHLPVLTKECGLVQKKIYQCSQKSVAWSRWHISETQKPHTPSLIYSTLWSLNSLLVRF